jgi:putative ABC transport system permease protein
MRQVGGALQVSRALEVMVGWSACGVLLLLAQVQVGMRQRHQELVVWRTLGPGNRCCAHAVGGVCPAGAGFRLVAAIGAEVALAMLQTKVFDFPGRRTGAVGDAAADGSGVVIPVRRRAGAAFVKRESVVPSV